MKVLVVDDEPLAQQRLQHLLSQTTLMSELGVSEVLLAGNGHQALEICAQAKPDVVLLDIRMPGMDGIETARHLGQLEKVPAIIFSTAYDEYALDAFEVHAVDYLLKPVRQEKLLASLQRAHQLNRAQLSAIQESNTGRTNITAKISGNIKLIPVKDIFFFQADQKYVTVKHTNGETIIEDTLKELQQEFEADFVRVHRNALVAKKFITGIHKDNQGHSFVTINECDTEIEISRRHLSMVKKLISNL